MALGGAQKSENVLMNKGCSMGLILPETELLDLEGMKNYKEATTIGGAKRLVATN